MNGLPIEFFVIAGGIIVVLASWLLMRFGRTIAKVVLTIASIVIAGIVALAVLAQSAASFQTAQAAERTAKVAQTASNTNLVIVGAMGCFGGMALLAVIGALGIAGYFWLKSQRIERDRERARITSPGTAQALPEIQHSPVVWIMGDRQQSGVNLDGVDFSRWGW